MSIKVPICWECSCAMRCDRNAQAIITEAGSIYSGDRYRCPKCDHRVVVGFGSEPRALAHEAHWEATRLREEPQEVTEV